MNYISKDTEIYGTWVNEAYDSNINTYAKMTFHITNKWFDSKGGVWYTLRLEKGLFAVVYIDNLGETLSFAAERLDYPQNVDWTDLDHIPLHRFYTRK
jgi:hypothetical protein